MDKAMFNELLNSVREMDEIAKGKREPARQTAFAEPEVRAIREKIGLSQHRFALLIGVSKRTLENWEQGRRHPTGPARALLKILDKDTGHALQALHE
ncbi:MAG: helix-turn-helix domain-containing protein [Nitrococcus mobilis]|nr:helix-turn-helix domain-containing protein [Nitrococcus mobilis]